PPPPPRRAPVTLSPHAPPPPPPPPPHPLHLPHSSPVAPHVLAPLLPAPARAAATLLRSRPTRCDIRAALPAGLRVRGTPVRRDSANVLDRPYGTSAALLFRGTGPA